ncbi:MAG: hypothetical protein IJ772_05515 [Bacilli bacterium]|nr:hypothetical protein [Bacilli bacterium]
MNFVGGIVAKTQCGLVDKYKNLKATDPSIGKRVKGMIPKKDLSKELSDYNKGLAKSVLSLESHIESVEDVINSNLEGIPTYAPDKNGKYSELTYKKLSLELAKYLKLTRGNLENCNPAKEAKGIVFGIDAIVQEYPPSKYLEGDQWKTVLSKDFLNKMKEFVSDGKKLIKMFQTALKSIESVQKRLIAIQNNEIDNKDRGDLKKSEKKKEIKSEKKGVAGQMKRTRNAISQLTHYRNFAGKTTGILYGVYANCLKARSYYAAALRSYAAGDKSNSKNTKKAEKEKAFKERNGLS